MRLRHNSQTPTPNSQLSRLGSWVHWALGVGTAVLIVAGGASAQDMPDPSLIHGRAIPAPELPNGAVTVRVVREAIGNNVPGQQVRVTAGGATRTATTDAQGRAEFNDLPGGSADAVAEVTVDGERLVSQPFAVPASGGLRVILVAGIARAAERKKQEEAADAAVPPTKGIVVFGGNTRILMQFNNDSLDVYYLLEIVNSARTRVDIGGPLVIDLPPGATGASTLEGSSPTASAAGDHITIAGPFASGTTSVQAAFRMPHDGPDLTISQTWPAALQQVIVGVQKVGDLKLSSPQFTQANDIRTDNGDVYVLGNGPAQTAGSTVTFTVSGLPFHSRTPRYVAPSGFNLSDLREQRVATRQERLTRRSTARRPAHRQPDAEANEPRREPERDVSRRPAVKRQSRHRKGHGAPRRLRRPVAQHVDVAVIRADVIRLGKLR